MHTFTSSFQEFCRTPDFLAPLAQALCLVHDQKIQRMINNGRMNMDHNPGNEGYHMHGGHNSNQSSYHGGRYAGYEEFPGWSNPQQSLPRQSEETV